MYRLGEIRRTKVSGRMDNHERRVRDDWVVGIQHHEFPVTIAADPNGSTVHFESGSHRVASDWTPGKPLALMNVDGVDIALKVEKCTSGYRIRFRGADMRVTVRSPRQAELAQLMIEKVAPDTSKLLLCPMPGLIVKVDVAVGDEVQEGQTLCTVEAMKMENILRAEKKAVVSKIHAAPGDSLAVDAIIMEFE
jgi:propionyl-CoA carboxylase alpha chain